MHRTLSIAWRSLFSIFILLALLQGGTDVPRDRVGQVRQFTRGLEFDYVNWTLDALYVKLSESAVDTARYLNPDEQQRVVVTQLQLVNEINRTNSEITSLYANPEITDPEQAAAEYINHLESLETIQNQVQPVSEAILQKQVSTILAENGLTLGGQPIPPVLFHTTPLPVALIVSPREEIRQDANISLVAGMTTPEMVALEEQVEADLNVSALVVPVGGVGIYPTMVMSTTNLPWLAETVAHEWAHNFLTLRPLGLNYETTPQLRTMNETTASIVGTEIGEAVIRRYYSELYPPPEPAPAVTSTPEAQQARPEPTPEPQLPPPFDFRAEMHTTRITADKLLAEGKIEEAEEYMEMRRRFLWENGYHIRKLNQAYFAFHGAYADSPGGAAGEDPVGPAVRALRAQSDNLADFLNQISWMTSFEQLQRAVQ
jgi:hypothetical protein